MGLDMNLYWREKGQKEVESIVYWRKANHIHDWFNRNVACGNIEDCEFYPVSVEQLKNLAADCRKALNDRDEAPNIFPRSEGFFFGSQEYDEYYFYDISFTLNRVEEILEDISEDDEFFYEAWW